MLSRRQLLEKLSVFSLTGAASQSGAAERNPNATSALSASAANDHADAGTAAVVASFQDLRSYEGAATAIITAGYFAPGDGGGGVFVWRAGEQLDDGGTVVSIKTAERRGSWRRMDASAAMNVRWFGARGNGAFDDTAAFFAAQQAALARKPPVPVYVPPGAYVIRAGGLAQSGGFVAWFGETGASSIVMATSDYFLTLHGKIAGTDVRGLTFLGGKGAFRFTHQGENVAGPQSFADCVFRGYTDCAIGNNAIDHPYLKISRCVFHSANSERAIGVAWGGFVDQLAIENCSFLLNAYHIKIGPRLSGDASITGNDFISFAPGVRKADIWIVPSDSNVNAGPGLAILRNKFGNENTLTGDTRILVANELAAPGSDRLTRGPSTEADPDKAFVDGLSIAENRISGVGMCSAAFMKSYIHHLTRCIVRDNIFDGGPYTHFVEFVDDGAAWVDDYSTGNWRVDLAPRPPGVPAFSSGFSNRPITAIPPETLGASSASDGASGDDADFKMLASEAALIRASAALRKTAEGHFRCNLSNGPLALPLEKVRPGALAWVEITLRSVANTSHPLKFRILRPNGHTALLDFCSAEPNYTSVRAPFLFPGSASEDDWRFDLSSRAVASAQPAEIEIMDLHIYHSKTFIASGHLRTLGSGRWDQKHIVLGNYHLWIDDKQRLRLANSAPTADDDGRIVG